MQNEILQRARGVRDFGPAEKIARDKIVQTMKEVFESFGFNPIETPVLERYELFASKYGIGQESEAMQETFKLNDQGKRDLVLRTEFTLPFARFVGMNPELRKPFKRYQMGQVFRDGPIKLGRYREFWQCDIDMVGISDPIIDMEIMQVINEVFNRLGLDVEIRINNRKILNGILENAGVSIVEQEAVIVAIDKLDKIGETGVRAELEKRDVAGKVINLIMQTISVSGENQAVLEQLKALIGENAGLQEVAQTLSYLSEMSNVVFMPSLARGLAYYTGNVFEVYLKDRSEISSSICAGGRFDNMIGGLLRDDKVYPAVGVSFGLETIFDALQSKNKTLRKSIVDVYFCLVDVVLTPEINQMLQALRQQKINVDVSYGLFKLKKCLEYAASYGIPWVMIVGEEEKSQNLLTLRNMQNGEQEKIHLPTAIKKIKETKIG